jgi:methionyl-tRNA formyltransferase
MLKKEDGRLDFNQSAVELERRIRAMSPWPGAWFEWNGAPLKVHKAHVGQGKAEAGKMLVEQNQPAVGTGGGILILDEVQPPGKKSMNGKSFLAGARDWLE